MAIKKQTLEPDSLGSDPNSTIYHLLIFSWYWSWNSNTLATSCEELTHWKRPWCWEGLGTGGEGTTEDEMARWHHQLNAHEFEWTLGVCDGQGRLACCDSWGHKESDTTERLNWTELNLLLGEGNGKPLQYSCLENPADRGAWRAAVCKVAQSQTRLKRLSMHACIGEGNGNPLQYSCLENPRDKGAWWAAVYGVAQSRTRLKQLSSSSSNLLFVCFTYL